MDHLTDIDIMALVQQGDLGKMGMLYERHKKGLFAYFFRCTNDRFKSEDLVQNVFERVIKYRNNFGAKSAFNHWLYKIARNVWITEYRKNDPLNKMVEMNPVIESNQAIDPAEIAEQNERTAMLKHALSTISPEKRDAIVLSRYHGMTYKTIAEMSDCSENAIKARVMRGIVEIRNVIQNRV